MQKHLVLVAVLGFLLFPILNPSPSLTPPAIGIESNEKPFFAAGDGSQSSDSIYSFGKTLDDDVMFYPDAILNSTAHLAVAGSAYPGTDYGSYLKTHVDDSDNYETTLGEIAYIILNFTLMPDGAFEGVRITAKIVCSVTLSEGMVQVLDFEDNWINVTDLSPGQAIYNIDENFENRTFWNGFEGTTLSIRIYKEYIGASTYVGVDYVHVYSYQMHLSSSDHYAESFADVSDWSTSSYEAEDSYSTDSDVVSAEIDHASGTDWHHLYSSSPSITGALDGYYVEIRHKTNVTGFGLHYVVLYTEDAVGGSSVSFTLTKSTSWHTEKFLVTTIDTIECVNLRLYTTDTYDVDTKWEVDYLRIGPSDEMGWQHDCSTSEGVTDGGGGSSSSDGDELTLTADADGSTFEFAIDTTATAAYLDADYYPMIGLDFNGADSADYIKVESYDGAAWATVIANTTVGTATHYANCRAADADIEKFRISVNPSANPRLKWFKAFSIANFTIQDVDDESTSDVLYVSGGVLYCSGASTDYFRLVYDPALSVNTDTYPVWNATVGSGASNFRFRHLVGSWEYETTGETRGDFPSGTLTEMHILLYGACTLSAIKFIEDGTAPDILDKFIDPGEPYDDETVTVMTVAYDGQEVYKCTINAVVCPAAFSDVDYEMTETDQEHVFTYAFSSLTAGYYLFQIKVSDGANTYEEYISVRVREAEILITTYTFFGASSDFSYMQFSGYISRDCTYNILEWSDTWAKNETHTGSVTEGMFNIAWDKIGVDDLEANFTIVFVNGSLSKTIPGYYGTAYKELRITEIEIDNPETSQANTNITANFYANKDIDWFVYDVDDSDAVLASGSSVEGSGVLLWEKDRSPHAHNYAIKWTDGVSNIWFNSSYWTYRENIDSIDQPGKDWGAIDTRRTIEFWTTLTGIVLIIGLIVIGASHYRLNKKIKNLPNYSTQR